MWCGIGGAKFGDNELLGLVGMVINLLRLVRAK